MPQLWRGHAPCLLIRQSFRVCADCSPLSLRRRSEIVRGVRRWMPQQRSDPRTSKGRLARTRARTHARQQTHTRAPTHTHPSEVEEAVAIIPSHVARPGPSLVFYYCRDRRTNRRTDQTDEQTHAHTDTKTNRADAHNSKRTSEQTRPTSKPRRKPKGSSWLSKPPCGRRLRRVMWPASVSAVAHSPGSGSGFLGYAVTVRSTDAA